MLCSCFRADGLCPFFWVCLVHCLYLQDDHAYRRFSVDDLVRDPMDVLVHDRFLTGDLVHDGILPDDHVFLFQVGGPVHDRFRMDDPDLDVMHSFDFLLKNLAATQCFLVTPLIH
jgi:hypothetical protein